MASSPKYIGKGVSGCVFKPAILCSDGSIQTNANMVSKVFSNKAAAAKELAANQKIKAIDPSFAFSVQSHGACPAHIREDKLQQCGREFNNELTQIVYDYAGHDLRKLKGTGFTLQKFISSAGSLFHGLVLLDKHAILHADIKCENVVYNPATRQSKFIDFGHSIKTKNALDLNMYYGVYVPPEYNAYVEITGTDKDLDDLNAEAYTLAQHYDRAIISCGINEDHRGYNQNLVKSFEKDFGISLARFYITNRLDDYKAFLKHMHTLYEEGDFDTQNVKAYFLNNCANRYDVYTMGILMLDVMVKLYMLKRVHGIQVPKYTLVKYIDLIYDMTRLNPLERLTASEANERFTEMSKHMTSNVISPSSMMVTAAEMNALKKLRSNSDSKDGVVKNMKTKLLKNTLQRVRRRFDNFDKYIGFLKDQYVDPAVINELKSKQAKQEIIQLRAVATHATNKKTGKEMPLPEDVERVMRRFLN